MPPVSFNVTLSSPPAGGVVGGSAGVGTIYPGSIGPSVSSVSSVSGDEGTSLVHTVTLSAATTFPTAYAFTIGGGTAIAGTDYNATPTFTNGVTLLAGTLTVPSGVTSFGIIVAALTDALTEGTEFYSLSAGGVYSTGNIQDPGSSLITPSVVVRRVSGPAPLLVHFDASGTTAAALTDNPFFDIDYTWDFDDPGSGDWSRGAYNALSAPAWSKNMDKGPITAHVYENVGNYNPTCLMRFDVDTNTHYITEIEVTNPNTVFAGALTVAIGNTLPVAGVNGVPAGATCVASSDADAAWFANYAAGKRIMWVRGDTFALSTPMRVYANDVYVCAVGSGAKPLFNIGYNGPGMEIGGGSSTTYNRCVTMDLAFDAAGYTSDSQGFGSSGGFDDWLCLRCDVAHSKFGWKFAQNLLDGYNAGINPATDPPIVHLWRGHGVMDCNFLESVGNDNGANGMYFAGDQMAIMGCNIDPNFLGEHGIRCPIIQTGVIAHNKVQRIDDGRAYITLRSPDQGSATFPAFVYGPYVYSEKVYVHDNDVDGGTTQPLTTIGIGPVNQSATGRARMMLFERNYLRGIETNIAMQGTQGHCRLNLFLSQQLSTFFVEDLQGGPKPTDQHWYHNSVYSSGTTTNSNFWSPNDGGMTSSEVAYIRNNLIYQPGRAGHTVVSTTANMTTTASNNTDSTQVESNNPYAATTPPTTALHYKPAGGSYAIDAGIDLAVWSDFLNVPMYSAGTRDMGAIQS